MPPESAKYLQDILDAIGAIEQSVLDKTADDYLTQRPLRDAAHWNLCVIGEALSQLKKSDPDLVQQITDSPKIIGLRNQLIHGYGVIKNEITWRIITDHLPLLHTELDKLLAE